MNDNVHDRLINGTGHFNTYIGFRLQRCSFEFLKEKYQFSFDDNWEMEMESHHCELYNMFDNILVMNNSQKVDLIFYSIQIEEDGILIKDSENDNEFLLTKEYHQPMPIKRYEINCFSAFSPSVFKKVAKNFDYDFAFAIKKEYAHILYSSEKDQFYFIKEHEVKEITRDQVILPNDEMFFWNKFDELLEKHIVSSLEGATPSCLRIIADICDEYDNSVLKPDCFGLDKLFQFDEKGLWSEYNFEDSVMEVTKNVLRRFI